MSNDHPERRAPGRDRRKISSFKRYYEIVTAGAGQRKGDRRRKSSTKEKK